MAQLPQQTLNFLLRNSSSFSQAYLGNHAVGAQPDQEPVDLNRV